MSPYGFLRSATSTRLFRIPSLLLILTWWASFDIVLAIEEETGEDRQISVPEAQAPHDTTNASDLAPEAYERTRRQADRAPGSSRGRHKTIGYDIVRVGEDIHVYKDEVVRGDIVLLGGDLRVEGEIVGFAVVVGGNITTGPVAKIGGEVVAVGGRVDAASGADLRGGVVSLSFLSPDFFDDFRWGFTSRVADFVGDLLKLGFFMLAAVLLVAFVPERLAHARTCLQMTFLKCFGVGVLSLTGGAFAVLIAIVLLAITLVGIPVAFLLGFMAVVLLVASWIVGVLIVGERVKEAMRIERGSTLFCIFLGLATLMLPELLSDALRVAFDLGSTGIVLRMLYSALVLAALCAGLGAIVLSRLGAPVMTRAHASTRGLVTNPKPSVPRTP